MFMYEEAETLTIFGIQVYAFGSFAALGALAMLTAVCFLSCRKKCRKGTAPLLMLMCMIFGAIVSRIVYCLLTQRLGQTVPLKYWAAAVTGGGWSMMGLIGGMFAGTRIAAGLTGQKYSKLADITACALPLFIAFERFGEKYIEGFDTSRPLTVSLFDNTFLYMESEYDPCLATFYLAAIAAAVLFVILLADLLRKERDGNTAILFLLLFGAGATILESLRYDRFLSITFVNLEQIMAMLCLWTGVILACRRAKGRKGLKRAAIASLPAATAIGVGLEFAIDRTRISHLLIYAVFIVVIFIPAVLGMMLEKKTK
ncbi:MAG: prolipoprotein diacylglyceryl transferase [Clostridia bacterium]|nr:prolipoprotein diacylglyceryl transferase [Clostridia bacterium]